MMNASARTTAMTERQSVKQDGIRYLQPHRLEERLAQMHRRILRIVPL